MKLKTLSRREFIFVISWSFFLVAIVVMPYLIGYLATPDEKEFTFLVGPYYQDANSYMTWIKQAQDGHIFFQDRYTSEYTRPLIFHPVFLLMGLLQKVSHIPNFYIWLLTIVVADFVLLFSIYIFFLYFIGDKLHRILVFLLTTTAAGFGWFIGWKSIDIMLAETTVFQSLQWPFIFSIALTLMIWFFIMGLSALNSEEGRDIKKAVIAGIIGFFLTLIHPYDVATILTVFILYVLFFIPWLKKIKSSGWQFIKKLGYITLPIFIPLSYFFVIERIDWVLQKHNSMEMLTDGFVYVFSGLGLILLFAIFGARIVIKKREKYYYFLILWALSSLVLMYLPLTFQRRLVMGILIPLTVIAARFLMEYFRTFIGRARSRFTFLVRRYLIYGLFTVFICFCAITNVTVYVKTLNNVSAGEFPHHIDKNIIGALEWLDYNSSSSDIVLSSDSVGSFIPRISGNTVYIGHWAQTVNINEKKKLVDDFYKGILDDEKQFLYDNNMRYIMYSNFERELGDGFDRSQLTVVYTNPTVIIYKVL